jgi:hypothetical protein
MTGPTDPEEVQASVNYFLEARKQATRLHTRAMRLGYNVGPNVSFELTYHGVHSGQEPSTSFQVRRIDKSKDDALTFDTASDVEHHLDRVEEMPCY